MIGNFNLTALIDMLEEDGDTKVLAEPNLTTVSGATAKFFAGGEFPILIPQGGNLIGTVIVDFKKFGVSLEFTPVVDLNGLITMHIVPEVSDLDRENGVILAGFVIPGLRLRRVDTIVKLWPGQSYVLAGLYLDGLTNTNDNLYGLNKIPFIGSLFGSNRYEDARTELLFIVTPYLVQDDSEDASMPDGCGAGDTITLAESDSIIESKNTPEFIETEWETEGIFDYSGSDCTLLNEIR